MPSIHYLNPPPNPFWDFVSSMEDHPFFAAYGPSQAHPYGQADPQGEQAIQAQPEPQAEMSEKAQGKQPTVEDPPEVDPATVNQDKTPKEKEGRRGGDMPFRGRGRFANALNEDSDEPRRGHGCRGRGGFEGRGGGHRGGPHHGGFEGRGGGHHGGPHHGGPHHGGPPPFMFGPRGPWWARRGPPPDFDQHHGPGPHRGGPPHHHHHRGPHGHSPGRGAPGPDFNLGDFLGRLGQRLGVDLSGAAEGLGLDRHFGSSNSEAQFEPRADVFDTATDYTVHVSLPGAKKDDVGVDWDGENSLLRVAGVVHRPGADEAMLSQLVVDGRKRETGVFEKSIRLGTKRDPAGIDVAGISAKMADGILVVKVPKIEIEHKKRDVPISGSAIPSPARQTTTTDKEKNSLLNADDEMYDAVPTEAASKETAKDKEAEHQAEVKASNDLDARSETMDYEQPEQLPKYNAEAEQEEEDWEKAGSDEEGEYVKISVD